MAVYACSDLHGMLNLYNAIKETLQPEDIVYFLGDAGDRGPEPWKTIKAIVADPQFIYLKGNHEDMLTKALSVYWKFNGYGRDYSLLKKNGGEQTFKQCIAEEDTFKWYNFFKNLPVEDIYVNNQGQKIYLSHAGFTPWVTSDGAIATSTEQRLIWDRDHIDYDCWPEDEELNNVIVVHGHTPVPYLNISAPYDKPYWYCDNHKVDIDFCSVVTGVCALLNLDTWEQTTFYTTPYYNITKQQNPN